MTQTNPMVVSLLRCLASLRLSLYRRLQWAHPSTLVTSVDVVAADPGSTVTFLKSVPAAAAAVGLAEAEATAAAEAATTAFRVAEVAAVEFCEMSCFRLFFLGGSTPGKKRNSRLAPCRSAGSVSP